MKKLVAFSLAVAMMLSLASCSNSPAVVAESEIQSQVSSQISSEVSEYPSSKEELSSTPSSDVSSIVSEIGKVNTVNKSSSSKPTSSKVTSSKTASSKPPVSSKPPASSKPPVSSKPESKPQPKPEPPKVSNTQMKAVWLSFLEFQKFQGSSESDFTNTIGSYFDNMVNKGLNTVIAQVRPHGDAFYESAYYPWSKCISGTMGQGVDYDPLAIMVSEAHSRGLEIHAWLNPYRTMNDAEMALVDSSFPVKQWYDSANRSDYMVQVGTDKRWWLKPGNQEVQQLIINGAKEIAQKYKVDGIHLDDYFYGTNVSTYGDSVSQAKANTTELVKGLYSAIKSVDSSVKFGISPAGGFRENNSLPSSDMTYLSTDLKLWCQNKGYIDYVMPQLYWGYDHATQPYVMSLDKWQNFVTEDSVTLYIGLAPSGLDHTIVESQIKDIENSYKAKGYCLFRYEYIRSMNLN
ncbi:MAG: family 10 glycosylhydrolase [Oscillospiraceae bacterium]